MDEPLGPDLSHPDAVIRLASSVHRFQCPEVLQTGKLSFEKSFKTSGAHPNTASLMRKADQARGNLAECLVKSRRSQNAPQEAVVLAANEYVPLIHSILLSCKFQSENAQLDQRLTFQWSSGLEAHSRTKKTQNEFTSEALMFELVMTVASTALGTAGTAVEECLAGNFAAAGRGFKKAAGILQCLAEDELPKWIARGSGADNSKDLPCETSVGVCDGFRIFFLAVGQQMAVATVLIKPGVPNYSLLAKLTLGIKEQMESFVSTIRSKAAVHMSRIDPNFFTLVTFQINLQNALSQYFLARSIWDQADEYGLAIAILHSATQTLKTRDSPVSKGLPEITSRSPLKALEEDLTAFRKHTNALLLSWESDNSKVYFTRVPTKVPEDKKLLKGLHMMKPTEFKLEDVDPVHLGPVADTGTTAAASTTSTDEALAREMQEKMNRGEMD